MSFILMAAMSLVPMLLGMTSTIMFKTKLTKAMLMFMFFISIWQLDVSFLYSLDLFSQDTIFFMFRLLRVGSIMLPPAFLYVGYVAMKHLTQENSIWLKWVINKYTLAAYYTWSLFVYIVNWTDAGVLSLNKIKGYENVNVLYPVYGDWSALFSNHIKLLIVSIVLTLIASRKVMDTYVRLFLTLFSLSFLLTYCVGVLNLQASTFIYSSQIGVLIFSIFIYFTFVHMNTKMFKDTNQILKRKEREQQIEITTSGLIHEIRNPLTVMKGYSDLLVKYDRLDKKAKGMADQIQMAGSHMNSIVLNYNEFIKSGKITTEETNVMYIIREAILLTGMKAAEHNVTIELKEEEKSKLARIDKDKIRQVLINLIHNSIEAMEEKEHKCIKIWVKTISSSNEINIILSDTGCGIPVQHWKQIFTPFHTSKETGMGLGLSICQRILNSHGGNIEIVRSDDNGTEMKVTLPVLYNEEMAKS